MMEILQLLNRLLGLPYPIETGAVQGRLGVHKVEEGVLMIEDDALGRVPLPILLGPEGMEVVVPIEDSPGVAVLTPVKVGLSRLFVAITKRGVQSLLFFLILCMAISA